MKIVLLSLLILGSLGSYGAENKLFIEQHRWSVGGSSSLSVSIDRRLKTSLDLEFRPQASYFVWDGLELSVNNYISGTIATSDTEGLRHMPIAWGFGGNIRYYFTVNPILFPYVGALADFSLINSWTSTIVYNFGIEGGLLIGISERVALDISVPLRMKRAGSYFQNVYLSATYLGLKYFF